MNKIKQNAFWVGVGVAAGILAIAFGVVVVPMWTTKSKLHNQVAGLARTLKTIKSVPGNEDIRSNEEARDKAVKAYKEIGLFYTQSNDHLERWFEDLKLAPNTSPNRGNFMATYRGEKDKIEKALTEKGVKIGILDDQARYTFGFNWEDPDGAAFGRVGADEMKVLKEIQKRFWARDRVAKAIMTILNEGGKVIRVHDFRFFAKLHPQIQGPWESYPTGIDAVHYMAVGAAQAYQAPSNFSEYDLPQKLGHTMTFGFAIELPYSQVPRLISEILNPAAEKNVAARLLVNVVGAHISIREQNKPDETVTYTKAETPALTAAAREAGIQKVKEGINPINVMLTVTGEIIDFQPTELKKFEVAQGDK
jgi:hypothetical protein